MRPIGFSTGAIAKGDFTRGLEIARSVSLDCVELSALRMNELPLLLDALPGLPLSGFKHVSIHAPKTTNIADETASIEALKKVDVGRNIVLHPDSMRDFFNWQCLRGLVCIENMGLGGFGSHVVELRLVFDQLPEAGFCLDLGHARQVDPTMRLAHRMMDSFGDRLRQVHVSDVDKDGKHRSLSGGSIVDFRKIAHRIPQHIPIIIESTGLEYTTNELYNDELSRVRLALTI